MASIIANSVGILPPGALGVSLFYHLTVELTHNDGQVYFLERRNSASSEVLRKSGEILIATPDKIKSIPTEDILKPNLLTCYEYGFLPEVVLICPNPDQLLSIITTIVELLVQIYEKGELLQPDFPLPLLVMCSNGIYFQRFRQIFLEKLEEAILFGRLPDLWPDIMPKIISRFMRGITIQTGVREGNLDKNYISTGTEGADSNCRRRCY